MTTKNLNTEEQIAVFVSRFYADPLGFVLGCFDWENPAIREFGGPDQWQREFLTELGGLVEERGFDGVRAVDPIQMATSSGHGIGKSALTAWLILWIMSTRPHAKGVVTANTSDQLKTKTWGELGKWKKLCICGHWFEYNNAKGNMNLYHAGHKETWRTDAQTCREENSESFAGLHSAGSTPFYLYDEASAVPDKIWEVSEGGTTDGEPMWFVFGNPTRNTGRFRECFGRNRHRWVTRQIDSREVKITNKRRLQEWVDDYGEDSDFVRVRVRGVFPRAGSTQFIGSGVVAEAARRPVSDDDGAAVVIGVDVARFGDDQSVIYTRIGRDGRSIAPMKFRGIDLMELASRVAEHAESLKADAVMVDGGGVGGGVIDRLKQLGYSVYDVNFGSSAQDKDKYHNKTAEMWSRMREWLEEGGCIPDDVELVDELTSREYGFTDKGQVMMERKSDMKKRGLASPDVADSLALTFAVKVPRRDLGRMMRMARMRGRDAIMDYDVFGD